MQLRCRRLAALAIALASLVAPGGGLQAAGPERAAVGTSVRGGTDPIVRFINEQIRQGWEDNEVTPSDVATDAEWLRRVYLDLVGHIPPLPAVESFLADRDPDRRARIVEELLASEEYVRHWTTTWTNLLIGRQTPPRTSRAGMEKFLREAFARNRPWNETVVDLVTAEGHFEQNGAVNYLLSQMTTNDDAVQATAKTTRLFLGIQTQCTQCHNHPFNDWKQDQFWQFNSFFRQVRRVDRRRIDESGQRVDDYSELVARDFSGPVYFETRNGLMQVAYPTYQGTSVDPGLQTDRRRELARLMLEGEAPLVASAMVNRMWGHFFGFGFTRPVDDMGPHNHASHPELLDRLSREFIASGYDLEKLIRWIVSSDAYHLTSSFGRRNAADAPSAGETPLFSRVYVKPLTAEQLYDSLLVATNAGGSGGWEAASARRADWLQQFIVAFGTDEDEEGTTFDGTIPQALMMMNGPLVQSAISLERGSLLYGLLNSTRGGDPQRISKLYLTTLGREPSRRELALTLRIIKANRDAGVAYQDLLWALLNSNEFVFNH